MKIKERAWMAYLMLFTVLLVTTVLYWQANQFGFVLDDTIVIDENNFVKKGFGGIREILTSDSMTGYLGKQPDLLEGGRYRPLSLVMFAIEHHFFGLDPFYFHLMNLVWYLVTAGLLFYLLGLLFKGSPGPKATWAIGIATLLFMVHPVHTEVVANIKGRDEIMALAFGLIGWILLLLYADSKKPAFLVATLVALYLSFMAKESGLPLVVAIPLSLCFFRDFSLKRAALFMLLLFVPVVAYFAVRYNALGFLLSNEVNTTGIMNNPYIEATALQKYSTILFTGLVYLRLLFFPHPLTHDYYPWQIQLQGLSDIGVWLALAALGFLVYTVVKGWPGRSIYAYAVLFFLLTLSIVSNLLVNVGTLLNERFLYIPSVAFSLLVAGVLKHVLAKGSRLLKAGVPALFLLVAAAFFLKSYTRIPAWENTMSLNKAAIKVSVNSARANLFYGVALFQEYQKVEGDSLKAALIREANLHIERSLGIYPAYRDALKMKAGVAAEVWKIEKDLPALLKAFEEVMAQRPEPFVEEFTDWLLPRSDKSLMLPFVYTVGYELLAKKQKNFTESLKYLGKGYRLDQRDSRILFGLCVISHLAGKHKDAGMYGEQFLQFHGENAEILFYTGRSLLQDGMKEKGTQYLEKAYQLQPDLKTRI